jgi:hypothetical protein
MASHIRDTGRITARGSNPDWWNQYVEPQLETFQQQPLMRVKDFADSWLGDPTDPATMAPGTNLAVGWIPAAARRGLAEGHSVTHALKAGRARKPDLKAIHTDFMEMAEKYPHTAAHLRTLEAAPKEGFTEGSFTRGGKTSKQLRALRDSGKTTEELTQQAAKDNILVQDLLDYKAGNRPTNMQIEPGFSPGHKQILDEYYTKWLEETKKRVPLAEKILSESLPGPQGTIRMMEGQSVTRVPVTARHEFGHAAMALKDDPSHLAYNTASPQFGYSLNPNEIRARAIAAKGDPRATRRNLGLSSYPKNDYMGRITQQIQAGARLSSDEQKARFFKALQSGDLQLPPKYYDYLQNVEPADYMKIQNWMAPSTSLPSSDAAARIRSAISNAPRF